MILGYWGFFGLEKNPGFGTFLINPNWYIWKNPFLPKEKKSKKPHNIGFFFVEKNQLDWGILS